MTAGDWALLISGGTTVVLALIGAAVYFIRSDYRMTLSATVAKRNPPQPRKEKTAEQATVTDIAGRGAA